MDLIAELQLAPERIAVELNQNVVRRIDWAETKLKPDDRIEIVHFVGGGEGTLATDLHGRTRIRRMTTHGRTRIRNTDNKTEYLFLSVLSV